MVYLVLGVGRSGTSTVARVLHTKMGIPMGDKFRDPDVTNPNGFWEDLEFHSRNAQIIAGKIPYTGFSDLVRWLVQERMKKHENWGIKDPLFSYLLGLYLPLIEDDVRVVHCSKDLDKVVRSLMRCYQMTHSKAKKFAEGRLRMIENYRRTIPMIEIDFTEHQDDEDIVAALELEVCLT